MKDTKIAALPESLQHGVWSRWRSVRAALARIRVDAPLARSLLPIPLFGALLLVALWVAIIAQLHSERKATLAAEMRAANSFVAAFSEYTSHQLQDIDRATALIAAQFARNGRVDLPYLIRNKLVPDNAAIRISVTDRAGNVIASNRKLTATVNVADRAFFKRQAAANTGALDISAPHASSRSGQATIEMSRRLDLRDGSFGGVVILAVDPAYFTDFYVPFQLGPHGMLGILGLDGVYRVRRSGNQLDAGFDGRATPLYAGALANGAGSYIGVSVIDHIRRLVAYRRLAEYPLIVTVGKAESEVLAPFEQRRWVYLVSGSVVSLVIVLFFLTSTVLAYRLRRRAAEARRQRAFLSALVDNMPLGVVARSLKAPAAGQIMVWNPAAEFIFGVSAASALGKSIDEVLPPEFAAGVMQRDQALLESPMVQDLPGVKAQLHHVGQRALRIVRAPIFAADDQVEYVVAIIQDVTAEQATADAQRLSAKVFEATADAIVISDANDRVIAVNAAFTKITGFAPDEMLGKPLVESPFRAADPAAFAAGQQQLLEDGSLTTEVLRYRKDGDPLPCWLTTTLVRDDKGAIVNYLRVFTDISKLKEAQSKLMWLANLDVLTGLPTRRIFRDRLEHALVQAERARRSVGLLFIDLDHFKTINDLHGHDVGDAVLQEVARRLKQCARASDSLCRLGGDEFTIVMEDATFPEAAQQVAERIIWALDPPIDIGGHALLCRASIGIAIYPTHGHDAETLLKQADMAMYQAKHAGRERCVMATAVAPVPVALREDKRA